MKARQAEKYLARKFGYLESEVEARFKGLRANGKIPMGIGPSAADLEAEHLVLMLLMLVPRRAVEAFEVGLRAGQLHLVPPPGIKNPLDWSKDGPLTFAGALLLLLLNRNGEIDWQGLRVEDDGRRAFITIVRNGRSIDLVFVEPAVVDGSIADDPDRYQSQGSGYLGQMFVAGAGALQTLAENILGEGAGGARAGEEGRDRWESARRDVAAAREAESQLSRLIGQDA